MAIRAQIVAALLGLHAGVARQLPPPPPPPPSQAPVLRDARSAPTGTGLLLGRVVDADSGKPIPGVIVNLSSAVDRLALLAEVGLADDDTLERMMSGLLPAAAASMPVVTDGEGRFIFRDLAKGTHTLRAIRSGYATASYGQTSPDRPGRQLALEEGERRLDVELRMWKLAAIGGTVLDEAGDPVVGVLVRTFRRTWVGGRRRLSSSGTATTDDRGHYRIFTLVPGEYVVAVPSTVTTLPLAAVEAYADAVAKGATTELSRQRSESGAPYPYGPGLRLGDLQLQLSESPGLLPPTGGGRLHVYPTVYYPNAFTTKDAAPFRLGSGEERSGVDFRLQPAPTVRVAGTVAGPDLAAANLGVRLIAETGEDLASDFGFETAVTSTDSDGQFVFPAVLPGQYVIKAYRLPRAAMQTISTTGGMTVISGSFSPNSGAPSFFAEMPLSVGETGIDGVVLAFRRGARVSGRIEFRGAAPRPTPQRLSQLSVSLAPLDSRPPASAGAARPDVEGRFTTNGYPPGRYSMNVMSPGPPWTLESVVIDGVNVLEKAFELSATDLAGAVVTFTDRMTEVSGTLQGQAGSGANVTVIAFPAAGRDSPIAARLTTSTTTDDRGTYRLRIPLAGDYFVAAVPPSLTLDNSPEMFAALERVAVRLTLAAGDQKTQSLTLGSIR